MSQDKNKKIKFTIDNKDFFCDTHFLNANQFIVESIPKPYLVTHEESNNPFGTISTLLKKNKKNLLIIDKKIFDIYQPNLDVESNRIFIAEAGENFKTLGGVTEILDFLQKNKFTKSEELIVVGGGTIQDTAAFASGIYKRGISCVQFPTTLLSMCDSCIGGKASVNYHGVKNQLGLFFPASAIYINPYFLKTLPQDDINSGLAEILKSCIIGGNYFIELYCHNVIDGKIKSFSSFKNLIMSSLCIKKSVVEEDEFEFSHRRSLNYGHTIGHAIESLSDYKISHGQAVVIGMMIANELSHKYGLLSLDNLVEYNKLCFDLITDDTLLYLRNINVNNIIQFIQQDKKTIGNNIIFVMVKSAGDLYFISSELNEKLFFAIQASFKTVVNRACTHISNCFPNSESHNI
ncbi:MAG TPA: 3-dehydroquinate synthase family protein [Coxiellaceae bacterium]|nr:MAG: hypothetical protein A3E81_04845 [Gammaproteobacteria bacterium RIFCSPHIGHO2_12_FULL_36_30]HLB55915.1 3-dehydroquinate synthase family protein [Coxiellaceae bacterium]